MIRNSFKEFIPIVSRHSLFAINFNKSFKINFSSCVTIHLNSRPMISKSIELFRISHCALTINNNRTFATKAGFDELTPVDREKEMLRINRAITSNYNKGNYHEALQSAEQLQLYIQETMGKENVIYASCLNNIALMQKMLGNFEDAISTYIDALHQYEDVVGKKHISYARTLSNLGVLCKTFAESTKGMEKAELLIRAKEALSDSMALHSELSGPASKDTIYAKNNLASVWRLEGKHSVAEEQLLDVLELCQTNYGRMYVKISFPHPATIKDPNSPSNLFDSDCITATTQNNLGFLYKIMGRYEEAKGLYEESFEIRSTILGDCHPDTLISMHNLAELLHATGHVEEAKELQQKIMTLVEGSENTTAALDDVSSGQK